MARQSREVHVRPRRRAGLDDRERDAVGIVYDVLGNRVSKTVNGVTTKYLVEIEWVSVRCGRRFAQFAEHY